MNPLELILEESSLPETARQVLDYAGAGRIFLFHAEMGAGKTTFIKALCSQLGVNSTMSSPTYAIVNEYHCFTGQKIYHFDLYRLKTIRECLDIGLEEYLYSGNYCFIEWPDIAQSLITSNSIHVTIDHKEKHRYLRVEKKSADV